MNETTQLPTATQPASQAVVRFRIKILGGRLSADQWRTLAAIAAEFTPATPLHLTTRQDLELHDVPVDQVPLIQQRLAPVDLAGKSSCGDTVRNTTVCPCSGVRTGLPDLVPLGWMIRRTLEDAEGPLALPRKFKVSLSACPEACGQPWINDVGFVAVRQAEGWAFRTIVSGSLGPRPAVGMVLHERLSPGDVLPLALAALRVFATHGDRKNRTTARLRHVRQRMGDEKFAELMGQAFAQAKAERDWPAVELPQTGRRLDASLALTFPDGNLSIAEAIALADLAARGDLAVRIDTHHRVILAGADEAAIRHALADSSALEEVARPQPSVVACPGRRWCKNGLTDTGKIAQRLRRQLGDGVPAGTIIAVSGCPNNCTHGAVAAVALSGRLAGTESGRQEAYDLWAGGEMGQGPGMARKIAAALSADDAVARVQEHLDAS
jgi:sulfite reductase (ferredoxin)